MKDQINKITFGNNTIPVTHDHKDEIVLVLDSPQVKLFENFIRNIIDNTKDMDIGYKCHIGYRSFLYPDNIKGMLVSYRPEATYYLFQGMLPEQSNKDDGEKILTSIHQAVQEAFGKQKDDISNKGIIYKNQIGYLGIQENLSQKMNRFGGNIFGALFQ